MEKSSFNQMKHASLKRMLVNRVIAVAVISIVITGGLALLLYLTNLTEFKDFAIRQQINDFIPGLFDVGILVIFAFILAIGLVFLLMGKPLQSINHLEEKSLDNELDDWDTDYEHIPEQENINYSARQSDDIPEIKSQTFAMSESLKAELASEKLINNLVLTLLKDGKSDLNKNITIILETLGNYCMCDFAAIYKRDGNSNGYQKIGIWDAEPELARHSLKLDYIDLPLYKWMQKTIKSGKSFTFRTAMLDSMMESIQNAADDVKAWMTMQAQESSEHKLSRHEGWEYFICFPCMDADEIEGLFLVGYQKANIPISAEIIERLASISGALGKKIYAIGESEAGSERSADIQSILNSLDDAVFTTDIDGNIILMNHVATDLVTNNKINAAGKDWNEVFPLLDAKTRMPVKDPVIKIYREFSNNIHIRDTILLTLNGREIPVEGMAAPIQNARKETTGIIFILRDISDRQRLVNERCETEKMEAISSLSSGFAHDFNNILTAILGNISLAMDDVPPNSETAAFLKAAEDSTLKGKTITDNLLAMAKSSPLSETATNAMTSLEPLVNNLLTGTDVKPVFLLPNNLPRIKMSAETLEKIIKSIVTNSVQAMQQSGILTVSAREFIVKSNDEVPLSPGSYICIRIKDTGEGIPAENQSRIFVPYFTTRKGASGLGLTIAYSLLKKHNGYIRLQSVPGKGTECEIFIPLAEALPSEQPETISPAGRNTPLALVLDADDALGNLLIKTMVKMGLRVQKTTDPDELSTLFFKAENNGSQVKLVVADLNLPAHSDIPTLMQVFKKADPRVKLIAYSNQLELTELNEYRRKGFDDILQKPFNIADLKAVVQRNVNL